MGEKKLEAGEYVYHEGDSADVAYTVISGKIELLETVDGREVPNVTVTQGKILGDLALFDPQSLRPYSARALESTTLVSMTTDEFKALVAQCPKDLLPFMQLAFDKMRATKVKQKALMSDAVLEGDISVITVAPAGDKLKDVFKPIEIPLIRLPFRIGGYPEGGEVSRRDQLHLAIASQDAPLRVSRQHCEITVEDKKVVLVDLGSRFCTTVNGRITGRGRGSYISPLKKGVNNIILGAPDGQYKLTITCA